MVSWRCYAMKENRVLQKNFYRLWRIKIIITSSTSPRSATRWPISQQSTGSLSPYSRRKYYTWFPIAACFVYTYICWLLPVLSTHLSADCCLFCLHIYDLSVECCLFCLNMYQLTAACYVYTSTHLSADCRLPCTGIRTSYELTSTGTGTSYELNGTGTSYELKCTGTS